jgi:hypothetical protein
MRSLPGMSAANQIRGCEIKLGIVAKRFADAYHQKLAR